MVVYCNKKHCEFSSSLCLFCDDECICDSESIDIDTLGNCNTYTRDLNKLTKCSECEELSQYE